jgi:integrase
MASSNAKTKIIPLTTQEKPKKERANRGGLTKRGRFYHYCFEVDGVRHTGSTKQETLKEAKLELVRQRQKANHQTNGTPYNPLLSELITEWETTQRADNHSEKHIANCSRLFNAHVYPVIKEMTKHDTGDIKLDAFTDKMVEQIKISYNKDHTEHGCNTLLRYVKGILRYGRKNYHIDIPEITKLKAQEKVIEYLDIDEIDLFLAEIDFTNRTTGHGAKIPLNHQISFAVRVMIYMGFREDEVISMSWSNYNAKNQTYTLDQDTKGGESPKVDIPDEVAEWIPKLEAMKNGPYLLHKPDGSKHHEGYTSNPVRRASKRIGRNFGPHVLRKTHGCLLAMVGTEAFTIQKTLRHKSIATSLLYVKVADKVVAQAQNKLMEALRENRNHK